MQSYSTAYYAAHLLIHLSKPLYVIHLGPSFGACLKQEVAVLGLPASQLHFSKTSFWQHTTNCSSVVNDVLRGRALFLIIVQFQPELLEFF